MYSNEQSRYRPGKYQSRRSVRKFSDRQISDGDMTLIIEAGRWAPSGTNAQPWQFIVIRDRAVIKSIADVCYYSLLKSRHVGEANVVVVILGNPAAGSATYLQDCTIAGANMTLMANALGIGSCWIGAFEDDTIRRILAIPEELKIIALVSFGYTAREPRVTPRLEHKDIVHLDGYSGSRSGLSIRRVTRSGPLSVLRQIIGVLLNRRS
ncbi:MAG TPA: nitroreductase family protein [Anaerolineae bacterium]|nr:nitroreductase family protein [Anaerolineae bacterium]